MTPARESVGTILEDIREGRPVLLTEPLAGRGPSVLMVAAERADAEAVNFMVRYGRGLVCLCLTGERWEELGLEAQPRIGRSVLGTDFGVSIEASSGVTTGISAADRARTIAAACDPANGPEAISTPGHILPVRAVDGGVLARPGQTEAAVELARMAGLLPAGVICEVIGEDGAPIEPAELEAFSREHRLKTLAVDDLIVHRAAEVDLVERGGERTVATAAGELRAVSFVEPATGVEHLAVMRGDPAGAEHPLILFHRACFGEHVLADCGADCGERLQRALADVAGSESGVLLYMVGAVRRHGDRSDAKLEQASRQILRDLGIAEREGAGVGEPR